MGCELVLLAILALGTLFVSGQNFFDVWNDDVHGGNGARHSIAARNYLRYSYASTRLVPVMSSGPIHPDEFIVYLRHPPLLTHLVSFSFRVFGESEPAARLVPLAAYLAALALLYLLVRRHGGVLEALGAIALIAAFPLTAYHASMVDTSCSVVLFFIVSSVFFYSRWSDTGSRWAALALGISLALGMMTDWPAYYLAALLPLWERRSQGHRWRRGVLWLPILGLFMGLGYFGYVQWITGDLFSIFGKAAGRRSLALLLDPSFSIPPGAWKGFVLQWGAFLSLIYALVFCVCPFVFAVSGRRQGRLRGLWWVLLATGGLHVLLFPQGAWIHTYWFFYLVPPLALSTSAVLVQLGAGGSRRPSEAWLRRVSAAGLFAALLFTGVRDSLLHFDRMRTFRTHALAQELRSRTRRSDRLLTAERIPQFGMQLVYYLDQKITPGISTIEQLQSSMAKDTPYFYAHHLNLRELPALFRYLNENFRPERGLCRGGWLVYRLHDRGRER